MQLAFTGVLNIFFVIFHVLESQLVKTCIVLILHRFFVDFFVDFKSLATLQIVLPCRREHYFYKIDVFASNPKIDPKTMEIWVQKSTKILTSPLPT